MRCEICGALASVSLALAYPQKSKLKLTLPDDAALGGDARPRLPPLAMKKTARVVAAVHLCGRLAAVREMREKFAAAGEGLCDMLRRFGGRPSPRSD